MIKQMLLPRMENTFGILALLALLGYWLHGHNLDGYWRGDDTAILLHMLKYPLVEIFIVPAVWQDLSSANLTPLVSLSFYIDYLLAGVNPGFYYWHHLVSITLLAFVTYLLLGALIDKRLALGGAVLFLAGTPVVSVSSQLMTRHYVEGLLFSVLALYYFLQDRRGARHKSRWLAVIFYLLAVTAKEIYVPLGVLLVALTLQQGLHHYRKALPYVLVMCGYVVWRFHMLPTVAGGYADSAELVNAGYWNRVLDTFLAIPSIVLGDYTAVMLSLFLAVVVALIWIDRSQGWILLLVAGLIAVPLMPLVSYPGIRAPDRYLFLPWYAFSFALVYALGKVMGHLRSTTDLKYLLPAAAAILAGVGTLLFARQHAYQDNVRAFNAQADMQMRFFWEHDQSVAFVPDSVIATNFWQLNSSREIKQLLESTASSPRPVVDELFLDDKLPLYEYSAACSCMADISGTVAEKLKVFAARRRQNAPLSLQITNNNGLVSWKFGPYSEGAYRVVSEDIGSIGLPSQQNNLRTNYHRDIELYLKYVAPDGWVTYSPLQYMRPDGIQMAWSRE